MSDKILALSELKAFADDKLNDNEILGLFFIVRKH